MPVAVGESAAADAQDRYTVKEVVPQLAQRFFFPLLFLQPDFEWSEPIEVPPFRLARRLWETSTFDLATLASRHRLQIPYQVMDVMLARCNVEVAIQANDLEDAVDWLHCLLLGLYVERASPTIAPFATSYAINDYSGINSRDSELLREKLPPDLRSGLTSDEGTVEAWPVQLSFYCRVLPERLKINLDCFQQAAKSAQRWRELEAVHSALRVVRNTAQAAPLLGLIEQSLLHIWCGVEALFPKVSTEVSFRLALYLAQLQQIELPSEVFQRTRAAYNLRSRIAHGSGPKVTDAQWREAWDLLISAASAILQRGRLPSEDELLNEILTKHDESSDQAV